MVLDILFDNAKTSVNNRNEFQLPVPEVFFLELNSICHMNIWKHNFSHLHVRVDHFDQKALNAADKDHNLRN